MRGAWLLRNLRAPGSITGTKGRTFVAEYFGGVPGWPGARERAGPRASGISVAGYGVPGCAGPRCYAPPALREALRGGMRGTSLGSFLKELPEAGGAGRRATAIGDLRCGVWSSRMRGARVLRTARAPGSITGGKGGTSSGSFLKEFPESGVAVRRGPRPSGISVAGYGVPGCAGPLVLRTAHAPGSSSARA